MSRNELVKMTVVTILNSVATGFMAGFTAKKSGAEKPVKIGLATAANTLLTALPPLAMAVDESNRANLHEARAESYAAASAANQAEYEAEIARLRRDLKQARKDARRAERKAQNHVKAQTTTPNITKKESVEEEEEVRWI